MFQNSLKFVFKTAVLKFVKVRDFEELSKFVKYVFSNYC